MVSLCSPPLIFSLCLLLSYNEICFAADTLTLSQSLSDGMTIESQNGTFQLGFFTPEKSSKRYLGIWYKNIPVHTVVWVANTEAPIQNFSALLQINSSTGSALLVSKNKTVLWSAIPSRIPQIPILQLLDIGNLVLRDKNDSNPENYLWQSFNHPSDTLLRLMKLGEDFRTGIHRRLTAWKSPNDPSRGELTWGFRNVDNPECVMWLGSNIHYRTGPWNGVEFSGRPLRWGSLLRRNFIDNNNESCIFYNFTQLLQIKLIMNETVLALETSLWSEEENNWMLLWKVPKDFCDIYGKCGPNAICDFYKSPTPCQCLIGFKPKSPEKWKAMKYSEGCIRDTPLSCQNDEFLKQQGFKVPDATFSWLDRSMSLKECREKCMSNCSCMAFANSDVRGGGSGCIIWFGDLIDIRVEPDGTQDLYVRIPTSKSERRCPETKKLAVIVGITSAVICGVLIVGFSRSRSRRKHKGSITENDMLPGSANEGDQDDLDLPMFELSEIIIATGNFSLDSRLGEGGFGTVYRGTLKGGQEIAVKRLSRNSRQGINEFKNEVRLITKLQHRNLVKLLGCCVQDEEKLLIYEFMPNKSLDLFLFDEARGKMLDWSKRFHIICGIARGLLYLHQDSRLRIIHRDLKASNILLDSEMNPKISDFGLARSFGGEDNSRNTNRVVGTHGYMAPEYAIDGRFSVKSDVFSFGVLVLEIVTGKRSGGLYSPTSTLNLIAHAWDFWKEGKLLGLIDERILGDSCNISEAVRCIHICLLCVQLNPDDRPSMSSILLVLERNNCLPEPKEPGFFLGEPSDEDNNCSYNVSSFNGLSVSTIVAR